MINQISNNKPSGYQSIDCDSGTPISGRTASNGSYQILKVSDTGSLLVQSGVSASGVQYQVESSIPVGTGVVGGKPAGTYMGNIAVVTTSVSAGWYKVSPSIILEASAGGSVTALLIKTGTPLDAYSGGLIVGVDPYQPLISTYASGGLACIWHNLPLTAQLSAVNVMSATGGNANTLEKEVYLEAGTYNLTIYVDTAITTQNAGLLTMGLNTLVQVA